YDLVPCHAKWVGSAVWIQSGWRSERDVRVEVMQPNSYTGGEKIVAIRQAVHRGRVLASDKARPIRVCRVRVSSEVVIEGRILLEDDHYVLDRPDELPGATLG